MKKVKLLLFMVAIIALLSNCKKDKDEGSFVDDYIPNLTEEAGVEYSGNYFPMELGYQWDWSGTGSTNGEMNIDLIGSTPINENNVSMYGYMNVVDEVTLNLGGVNYDLLQTSETEGMTRYFDKQNNAVFMRAFRTANSSTVTEVENPVYLKSPLVVGDSWETYPQVDYNELVNEQSALTNANVTVDMKCMFFVVGKETINLDGSNVETLRLDQRAEVNGTLTSLEGNMSFNIKMTVNLNLQENVGVAYQLQEMDMVMNGSFGEGGITIGMNLTLNVEGELTLDSYDFSGISYGPTPKAEMKDGRVIFGKTGDGSEAFLEALEEIVNIIQDTSL